MDSASFYPSALLPQFSILIGEKCGEPVDATTAGYITSPGYPSEYPPHQNCEWVITAPEPTQRIILNFNPHFELERLDCRVYEREEEKQAGDEDKATINLEKKGEGGSWRECKMEEG
ncbi:neuropilin-2a isoform X1 [Tachysurus ichikawai]